MSHSQNTPPTSINRPRFNVISSSNLPQQAPHNHHNHQSVSQNPTRRFINRPPVGVRRESVESLEGTDTRPQPALKNHYDSVSQNSARRLINRPRVDVRRESVESLEGTDTLPYPALNHHHDSTSQNPNRRLIDRARFGVRRESVESLEGTPILPPVLNAITHNLPSIRQYIGVEERIMSQALEHLATSKPLFSEDPRPFDPSMDSKYQSEMLRRIGIQLLAPPACTPGNR